jgi:hypothetical protein
MGSTIVLAWIIGQSAFIGWCGDSRAYCYHPVNGLKRLSHDHSYVQELVDSGKLSEELAFDHPDSNIITRSLGDTRSAAKPEVKEYSLHDGDIIMLCSDGLCGVLRDQEIEAVMNENSISMEACRDALWDAARNAGWHDNVTIGLCRILSGCEQELIAPPVGKPTKKRSFLKQLLIFCVGVIVGVAALIAVKYSTPNLYAKIEKAEEYLFVPFKPASDLNDSITVLYEFSKSDTVFIQIRNPNDTNRFVKLGKPLLEKDVVMIKNIIRRMLESGSDEQKVEMESDKPKEIPDTTGIK